MSPVNAIIVQVASAMYWEGNDRSRRLSHHKSNARPNAGPNRSRDKRLTIEKACSNILIISQLLGVVQSGTESRISFELKPLGSRPSHLLGVLIARRLPCRRR